MRVNVGINPKYLTNEHLLAEYHEIQMLASTLKKLYIKNSGSSKKTDTTKVLFRERTFLFLL